MGRGCSASISSRYILLDALGALEQSCGMEVLAVRVFQFRFSLEYLRGFHWVVGNHRYSVA